MVCHQNFGLAPAGQVGVVLPLESAYRADTCGLPLEWAYRAGRCDLLLEWAYRVGGVVCHWNGLRSK